MNVDLHTHTFFSDGCLSPEDLLDKALCQKIDCLAITDHDTVAAHKYLEQHHIRDEYNAVKLITGVEFSCCYLGMSVHIVGLNIDIHHEEIQQAESKQVLAREKRLGYIQHYLEKSRLFIDVDALKKSSNQLSEGAPVLGRPHIAKHLVETGQVKDVATVFRKYLGSGKIGDVNQFWPDMETVIHWVHAAGGVAILAHPHRYRMTRTKRNKLIANFKEDGGDGIEVIGGEIPMDVVADLIYICEQQALLMSVGSDFHNSKALGASSSLASFDFSRISKPVWSLF